MLAMRSAPAFTANWLATEPTAASSRDQPHQIFKRLQQLDEAQSRPRKPSGSGLGISTSFGNSPKWLTVTAHIASPFRGQRTLAPLDGESRIRVSIEEFPVSTPCGSDYGFPGCELVLVQQTM